MKLFFSLLPLCWALTLGAAEPALTRTPVKGFKLPTFTKEGYRSMLLQGTEALVGADRVELTGMNLALYSGDQRNTVETIILSPAATAELDSDLIHGEGTVRFIRDDLEITGTGWSYDHRHKKVSITRNSRVVFQAQMPDILK